MRFNDLGLVSYTEPKKALLQILLFSSFVFSIHFKIPFV